MNEDGPTSQESHEKIKVEVVETISEMATWGEMHEELNMEEVTPMSKVEECIVQLCKEKEATIVNKKFKKIENKKNNKNVENYVLKLLIEHNYRLLEKDGGRNYQHIRSWYSLAELEKQSRFLRGNLSAILFSYFHFHIFSFLVYFSLILVSLS